MSQICLGLISDQHLEGILNISSFYIQIYLNRTQSESFYLVKKYRFSLLHQTFGLHYIQNVIKSYLYKTIGY